MQDTYITELLNRYFEGETSLEEEQMLKQYFSKENIAIIHQPYKVYFAAIKADKAQKMPIKQPLLRKSSFNASFYLRAASLVFLLSAGVYFFLNQGKIQLQTEKIAATQVDTYDDPEQAYLEVKAALALISRKLDKSKKSASKGLLKTQIIPQVRSKLEQGK